jgi:arylsulfatase A-like enzyme
VAPAALIGVPMAALVRRLLGSRDVYNPVLAAAAAVAVVAVLATVIGATEVGRETFDALDLRLPVGALMIAAMLPLSHAVVSASPPVAVVAVATGLALSGYGLTALDSHPPARAALLTAGGVIGQALTVAQSAFDADGDGHARLLGGMDCNDSDPSIFPGALEVAGNGIDEDCSGRDLPSAIQLDVAVTEAVAVKPEAVPPAVAAPIILISVDTLRPDHLGAYGYDRPTSPNIDSLAAESAVFLQAYAPSNKTPDSMPAILTGRYASDLRRTNHHFHKHHGENEFLAERLVEAGWRTGGVAAHWYFKPKYGMHQGFERWEVISKPGDAMERMATSEEVTDKALAVLGELEKGDDERFMLFVHYLDPHKWYLEHEGFEPFGRRAKDRYDGEIRFTDHHLGRLLAVMRQRPWWDRATVALISDHGEAFGEHEERFHGWSLYEHEVRVPFLLKAPGVRPGMVGTAVSLLDLAPTLIEAAGLPAPPGLRGVSVLPALRGPREWAARAIYLEMPRGPYNPVVRSLIVDGRLKVIHRRRGDVWELYDLSSDPGEERNLSHTRPDLLDGLKDRLQRRLAAGRLMQARRG